MVGSCPTGVELKSEDLETAPFQICKGSDENVRVISTSVVCGWRQRGRHSGAALRSGGRREAQCQPASVDAEHPRLLQIQFNIRRC